MKNITFLPLGNQCRTSYQVRQFCESDMRLSVKSNPFDWTISPFESIKIILGKDFDRKNILMPGSLSLSKYNSIICNYTGLTFHHDLHISQLPECVEGNSIDWSKIHAHKKTLNAKNRFSHTYMNLIEDIQAPNLIVVRWLKAESFWQAENEDAIFQLVSNCRENNNFKLLYLHSVVNENIAKDENFVEKIGVDNPNIFKCRLLERPGFDGDRSKNFRGDTRSGNYLLEYVLNYFYSNHNNP